MYIAAKFSPATSTFVSYLVNNGISRSKRVSLLIGKALADRLQMPSSEVENISTYFEGTLAKSVRAVLGGINEVVIIDIEAVMQYTETFFKARYTLLNPKKKTFCTDPETIITDFFGITRVVSKETLIEIKSIAPEELTAIYNGVSALFDDVSEGIEGGLLVSTQPDQTGSVANNKGYDTTGVIEG